MRVDEHTISLDDSPVFYRRADGSGTPKLYLHGIPTSSDDWSAFLARAGGIAPDLLGFGRSGKGGHLDYSLPGLATFVERFLGHLGVEEVQLVGHDWGAALALAFAERNPARVRRLVLCNAPPLLEASAQWPRIIRMWRTPGLGELVMGATTKRLLARMLRRGATRADAWPEARVAAVWSQFDQGTQRAILRLVRSARENMFGSAGPPPGSPPPGSPPPGSPPPGSPPPGSPPPAHPPPPTAPPWAPPGAALIVWGQEDPWYPATLADGYAARLPGAHVERVPGAGHWPWLDRPEVVDRVASLLEG